MKTFKWWRFRLGDMPRLPGSRHRSSSSGPVWIFLFVLLVITFLLLTYLYPLQRCAACYIISSKVCQAIADLLPPAPERELSDEEIASRVVFRDILKMPTPKLKTAKIAFMFLGSLPFERLWDIFFRGHERKFTVYVHASREKPVHTSHYLVNRDIRSDQVVWGKISMVDAEKRLLANALDDFDNQHFVLLSDSCVPLHDFDYIYNYLLYSKVSYID